jgi:hypothetical protein
MPYASPPPWQAFEDLVRRILEAKNFVIRRHSPRGDSGFDFVGQSGNEEWAIEVKYYRTARAQPSLIEAAAGRVVTNGKEAKARKGMLVVSCVLPPALRVALEEKFGITFLDRVDLRDWAAANPELVEELDAVVEAEPSSSSDVHERREDPRSKSRLLAGLTPPPKETRGAELCEELKRLKRGRDAWAKYEELCARILRYLFPNDLHGWHKQKRTDDGLNRFDFVCRVRPTTEFWRFLIDHLNSRYVLFEFKNYAAKIKQGQILTTEKYLLERGLRRVALILTRGGAEPDALKMTQGAMREHGKLMLIIGDDKVCEMLHMKDRGEDPTDCLFDLADDFLLRLPR